MLRFVSNVFLAVAFAGCVFGLPPTRTEVGHGWNREGGFHRVAVGTHLGSLLPSKNLTVELGGGIQYESDANPDDMVPSGLGGFLDAGVVALRKEHARMIVGTRVDKFARGANRIAVKLRVDLEALAHFNSSTSDNEGCQRESTRTYGNLGFGLFMEGGPTWFTDDTRGWTAAVGVSVRLPAVGYVGIGCAGSSGGGRPAGASGSGGSSSPVPPSGPQ